MTATKNTAKYLDRRIPHSIRDMLVEEYDSIIQNYMERRWTASELSGGKFCEIVYSIIAGMVSGQFTVSKPKNMTAACRKLENKSVLPDGLRMLVLKILPALYEIRNNRGVGHAGGKVNANSMDSTVVVAMCGWIMAELIRTQHNNLSISEVQRVVDLLSGRKIPLVWEEGDMKRTLDSNMHMESKILVLLDSCSSGASIEQLSKWVEPKDNAYLKKIVRKLHKQRMVEFNESEGVVKILPPGSNAASKVIAQHLKEISALNQNH